MFSKYDADEIQLAIIVREACIKAAVEAYEQAGLSGLCHEGAWEYAIDAIQKLDIKKIIKDFKKSYGN